MSPVVNTRLGLVATVANRCAAVEASFRRR